MKIQGLNHARTSLLAATAVWRQTYCCLENNEP